MLKIGEVGGLQVSVADHLGCAIHNSRGEIIDVPVGGVILQLEGVFVAIDPDMSPGLGSVLEAARRIGLRCREEEATRNGVAR